jgi:hypothetical protein
MDWIHCNNCYTRPTPDGQIKFIFTSCGHILCTSCKSNGESCRVCNAKCNCIPLARPLPPQVELCMTDPMATLNKVNQVYQFQMSNRERLHSHALKEAEQVLAKLEQKHQLLYKENCYLKSVLHQSKQMKIPSGRFQSLTSPTLLQQSNSSRFQNIQQPSTAQYISPRYHQITLQTPQSMGLN